ncbi:hypothetical protein DWUX_1810 [Desulfovibrio diazotrophicus]|nr:hypothetical protein DWUX_1810 [Desulfovibrio diazotrophicus]
MIPSISRQFPGQCRNAAHGAPHMPCNCENYSNCRAIARRRPNAQGAQWPQWPLA